MDISGRHALLIAVRCMDLTSLEESDTPEKIEDLCDLAIDPDPDDPELGPVAAVCVYPRLVPVAVEELEGTGVRVAAATGAFPEGRSSAEARVAEIHAALQLGAEEIDTVLDHAALLDGGDEEVSRQLLASRQACGNATMKVILETGALQAEKWVRHAAAVAMNAGADFIKSSTGKIGVGATPEAARWMMEAVRDFHRETGQVVGVKLAGGIRTSEQAVGYVQMVDEVLGQEWLAPERFRIGASSLLDDIVNTVRGA